MPDTRIRSGPKVPLGSCDNSIGLESRPFEVRDCFVTTSIVQILRQRRDQVIEDAGRHFGRQRPAPLVDAVDPQAQRRRIDVPAEQPADARLDLRLQVGPAAAVERDAPP